MSRWGSIEPLVLRSGPFSREGFEPSEENLEDLFQKTILVVGAGGLGCEILKDLALSGFQDIHVIDLDTIDVSNLNRQFLFRMKDVGQPKAKVAAEFIMKRCPWVKCQWYNTDITKFPKGWYRKFDLVIAGLDNVDARAWLNETLTDLVKFDKESGEIDWDTAIPMIDGGTEGFNGQSRFFSASNQFLLHLLPLFNGRANHFCNVHHSQRASDPRTLHCLRPQGGVAKAD